MYSGCASRCARSYRRAIPLSRGVDVGGRHLAATADTNSNTTICDTRHIRREIDALKSRRDRCKKHGRKWTKYDKRIKILWRRVRGIKDNAINQVVRCITKGADHIVMENIRVKDMMTSGGARKAGMNRSMRENGVGEFALKLALKYI